MVVLALAVPATPARAVTTTLNFDAHANGDVITTESGATFANGPTVFTPAHVATQSPPKALHAATACPPAHPADDPCGRLTVTFATPASSVSLRVGMDDDAPGGDIPGVMQMLAYNASNTVVADSGETYIGGQGGFVPITTLVSVTSSSTDITKIVFRVGTTNSYPSSPSYRMNVDDLTFTDNAPPPTSPPAVTISSPTTGQEFTRAGDVKVSGHVSAQAGVAKFCVSTQATMPDFCNDGAVLDGSGNFSNLTVSGLHPGTNTVHAYVQDTRTRSATSAVDFALTTFDLRPANLEVTQAVQGALPVVPADDLGGPRIATYNGVPLAQGKTTFVRVWVDARFDHGPITVPNLRMALAGTRNGTSLGAPIAPINGSRELRPADVTGPVVPDAIRSDANSAFVFQLPSSWAQGDVSLSAIVNPAADISECETCSANNTLRLDGIHFTPVRTETVTPVKLFTRDSAGRPNPLVDGTVAFAPTARISPFVLLVRPYQAAIDISAIAARSDSSCNADCKNSAVFDKVNDFDQATPDWNRQGHITGVNPGVARGLTAPVLFCCQPLRIDTNAITDAGRPLTSVAHEYYHQLGFSHAGHDCPGNPGGFLGLQAESWDPDHQGRLQSFGFDPLPGVGGTHAVEGTQVQFFDFMSYCTDNYPETNSWISARNWTRALNDHRARSLRRAAGAPVARASAAGGPTLTVSTLKVGDGKPITHVVPGTGTPGTASTGKPDATIRLRNAAGKVVASAAATVQRGHANKGGQVESVGAAVKDPGGVASAEVRVGAKVLARVKKPRRAPRVKLTAPRRGTKVKSTGTVLVRWRITGARPKTVDIDFAADGRRFRPVVLGLRGSSYKVPVELLAKGSRARFRVRVSDGWNVARATSAAIRVAGPPPTPTVQPGTRAVSIDGTLQLEGYAYGDGRRLPSGSLSWYSGRRLLGRGASVRVSGLPVGRRHVTLIARARDGRRGRTSVALQVVR